MRGLYVLFYFISIVNYTDWQSHVKISFVILRYLFMVDYLFSALVDSIS